MIVFDGADSIENREVSGFIDIKHYILNVLARHLLTWHALSL